MKLIVTVSTTTVYEVTVEGTYDRGRNEAVEAVLRHRMVGYNEDVKYLGDGATTITVHEIQS